MLLGLPAALAAALAFGVATVLQAMGVRKHGAVRAMASLPFLAGLAVDGLGFVFQLVALRSLPLYVVQACVAGSLAVTAVVGALLLRSRLGRGEWLGVAGVCVGLAVLGATSGAEGHSSPGQPVHWALLAAAAVLALLGLAAAKLLAPGTRRAAALGLLTGLAFGAVAVAVRLLPEIALSDLPAILRDPALYAVLANGAAAFVMLAQSLVGGRVAVATAGLVLGETALPALLGVALLGDTTRSGLAPLAVAGFAVALAGALALARFGELPEDEDTDASGGADGAGEQLVQSK